MANQILIKRSTTTAEPTGGTLASGELAYSELSDKLFIGTAGGTTVTLIGGGGAWQPLDADLTSIAGLAGTNGILKKTAADTWTLDNTAYITTSSVTYETLNSNGDVGTSAGQLAIGDHTHAALYQPLDADLTSIAGLAGTTGFLTKTGADTWALDTTAYITTSSVTYETLNSNGDVGTGAGQLAIGDHTHAYIPTSYLDTDGALTADSDVKIATQKATKTYVDGIIAAANATVYKGAIDASTNPNYPAADAGWLYRISVSGKIGGASGIVVEAGDMIICLTDGTATGNQATVGAQWNIIQANLDGAVIGPASAVDNRVVFFDGTTGKLIKDSGLTLSGSNTGDITLGNTNYLSLSNQVLTGGTVGAQFGGTGQTVYAIGDLLQASSTTALSKLAAVATGNVLISGGVGVVSSWGKVGLTTHVSGTLAVANGGTGATTFTSKGVMYGNGTSAVQVTAVGTWDATVGFTCGQILSVDSAGTPTWTNKIEGGSF